jgi:fructosamine-3-kinase
MNIQEIKEQFEQVLNEVIKINGLTIESATQVAQVIITEAGKDRRAELLREARLNNNRNNSNGNQPATFKQKKALRNFGIKYRNDITKSQASELIDEAIAEANGNRSNAKGRLATAPSF